MATGRVWDGPPLPHFCPDYIFFFPSPSQTWGGASWCLPCPFTKKLIIPFSSQMYFRELCFYKTQVSEISINIIWVIINTFNQAFVMQQNCKLHIREQNAPENMKNKTFLTKPQNLGFSYLEMRNP